MIGPLISAGASLAGGLMNKASAKDAAAKTEHNLALNRQMQEEFAKKGIRWRVADAKAAGIHPLYALGANVSSYTPSSAAFASDNSMGNALASAGQDVGRAINATRTAPERADAFTKSMAAIQLESAGLDVEIKKATLASSLQRLQANANPPIPTMGPFNVPEANKSEERQPLMLDGRRIHTSAGTSPAKAVEDQLGDDIFSPGFLWNVPSMAEANFGPPATWPMSMVRAVAGMIKDSLMTDVDAGKRFGKYLYDKSVFSWPTPGRR